MRKSHRFPNAIVRVPSDKVEDEIHRDLLQIKPSLKDPRLWVGHYQPEDIVCFADSDGGIKFQKICKEGITRHTYPVKSKHASKPPRPTASKDDILRSQYHTSKRERDSIERSGH